MRDSHFDFPETRWTLIDALQQHDHPNQQSALDLLSRSYWSPIYAYLRRTGKSRERSADLTQSFFTEVVLPRKLFERADNKLGQVRALLLAALKHHVIDERRHARSGVQKDMVRIDQLPREEALLGNYESETPDQMYDRRWALALMEEALRRCEADFANGKLKVWQAFELRAIRPSTAMTEPPTYESIARELGFADAEEVVASVRVVRKKFLTNLHAVVVETTTPGEAESEYKRILSILM